MLRGEAFLPFFIIEMSGSNALCVHGMQLFGGGRKEIPTHIWVLGIHLEILDCSASLFIKVFTRFLTCCQRRAAAFLGACPPWGIAGYQVTPPLPPCNGGALLLIAKTF